MHFILHFLHSSGITLDIMLKNEWVTVVSQASKGSLWVDDVALAVKLNLKWGPFSWILLYNAAFCQKNAIAMKKSPFWAKGCIKEQNSILEQILPQYNRTNPQLHILEIVTFNKPPTVPCCHYHPCLPVLSIAFCIFILHFVSVTQFQILLMISFTYWKRLLVLLHIESANKPFHILKAPTSAFTYSHIPSRKV